MKENPWARLLAYVAGLINQELLLKNEYLAAENRILRAHLPARVRGYPIPKGPRWPKSASAWGGRRCPRSPALPARHNSGLGIESSSPGSSTGPNTAAILAGRRSSRNWRR